MRSLINVAEETDRLTESIRKNGGTAQDTAKAIQAGRKDIIDLGLSMGLSRQKAEELANKLIAIPDNINVNVAANTQGAKTRAQEIINLLNNIQSKTITVSVIESIYRQDDALARRANGRRTGGVAGAATGGARGSMTLVCEGGPEYVEVPFGSMVHNAGKTERMMSAGHAEPRGGGGTTVTFDFRNVGTDAMSRAMVEIIQEAVRTVGNGDPNYLAGN
jgi:flagellin-specific chaperone FliS